MKVARRVRRAAWGNGPRAIPAPRPRPTVVLCVDKKTQIQALNRTARVFAMMPGTPARATHDYVRHGTSSLYVDWT